MDWIDACANSMDLIYKHKSTNASIFVGGVAVEYHSFKTLHDNGINHVLDLTGEYDKKLQFPRHIIVKKICMEDLESFNIEDHFEEAHKFIDFHVCKGRNVLVMCAGGKSRSVTIAAAYIMKMDTNLSCEQVLDNIDSHRKGIRPNKFFINCLINLQN